MNDRFPRRLGAGLGVLWLVIASACQSAAPSSPAKKAFLRQPQSSLAALVRALEVVDSMHDPRAYVRVRAVECDSILDRTRHTEYARVVLALTVYAHDTGTAQEVFEHLALTLEEEAATPGRFDVVPRHRAERVFQAMNWDANGLPEDALSYSDELSLEMKRGRRPALPPDAIEANADGTPPSQPIREYVNDIAERGAAPVGPVDTDIHVVHPVRNARDMRVSIRPQSPDAHFTRDQIGAFLSELEAHSPLARITRVEIQRAPHLPNWNEGEVWTFEAVLTLRQASS